MNRFIANHADDITGVLSGFGRLVLCGTIRQLKEASLGQTKAAGRPVEYLPSSRTRKEDVARGIAGETALTPVSLRY